MKVTGVNRDQSAFDAFVAIFDRDLPAIDGQTGVCVHTIVAGRDGHCSAVEDNVAIGMNTIVCGVDGEGALIDHNTDQSLDSLGR